MSKNQEATHGQEVMEGVDATSAINEKMEGIMDQMLDVNSGVFLAAEVLSNRSSYPESVYAEGAIFALRAATSQLEELIGEMQDILKLRPRMLRGFCGY